MERNDFLDFIKCYSLSEILCGYSTPVLTEFEYARIYSSESRNWVKVSGNTFILMFDTNDYFTINVPKNSLTELKYSFSNKNINYNEFKKKFIDLSTNNVKIVKNEYLKIIGNYETIVNSMIYIKSSSI